MSVSIDPKSVLLVYLSEPEDKMSLKSKYGSFKTLKVSQIGCGRETVLSLILEHSQKLMAKLNRSFLDVVFIEPTYSYSPNYIKTICSNLQQTQFMAMGGFATKGKMGLYYDIGLPHTFFAENISMDIPIPALCAFRHYTGVNSKFQTYDNWNTAKYLDLELAFFAKEQEEGFLLIKSDSVVENQMLLNGANDTIHKAAIYNELFIKNTFDVKSIHHGSNGNVSSIYPSLAGSLNIIEALDRDIKNSLNKLEYVDSKIGNYDALKYNVQEYEKSKVSLKSLKGLFLPKMDDPVVFSLASIPEREGFLENTINSIYRQCDSIHVYLNGYVEVPSFLNEPKITVYRSQDHGDLSANGKVWFLNQKLERGYVFLIDDDIIYPKNYVQLMVETLQKYKHQFAVCVHGSIFSDHLKWYYQRSSMFPFKRALLHDCVVNLPGSGTFAFHTDTLKLSYDDFQPFTMVDLILGILCRDQQVPIVSVARGHDWLAVQKDISGKDLWSSFKSVVTLHTPTAIANGPWDFNSTKSYVLPHMEVIFGVLDTATIDELKLDKQFLHSAYRETIPELWSFAGRLQRATENNFQKFLFAVFNDQLDKCFDGLVYDDATNSVKAHGVRLQALNQRISYLLAETPETESNDMKMAELIHSVMQPSSSDLQTPNQDVLDAGELIKKLQSNIRRSSAKLLQIEKTHQHFMEKKKKLSNMKTSNDW